MAHRMAVDTLDEIEVDVVDRRPSSKRSIRYSGAPPMPLIAGRRSSIGPVGMSMGWAPKSSARW
jgi:hypothetical protein